MLLFGTAAGTITVTLDGLIISLWLWRRGLELHKLFFNTTAPALSMWLAAQLFFLIAGVPTANRERPTAIAALLPGSYCLGTRLFSAKQLAHGVGGEL